MATYTKTVWHNGDLITAALMQKIEDQLETVTSNLNPLSLIQNNDGTYTLVNGDTNNI